MKILQKDALSTYDKFSVINKKIKRIVEDTFRFKSHLSNISENKRHKETRDEEEEKWIYPTKK